jgi:hypothetical protein
VSTTDGQPPGGPAYPPGPAFPPGPTYGVPPQNQPPTSPFGAPPPTVSGGAPLPAPSAPPAGGKKASGLISIVVLVLVAAGIYGVSWFTHRNDIDKAAVGDCATYDTGKDSPFAKADCSDAAATYVVLKQVGSSKECIDVAGAERSISIKGGYFCFGLKGVDPATSINVAAVGDCLKVVGNDATRVPCTAPEATHKVLKRATDVVKSPTTDPCDSEKATDAEYGWSWHSDDGIDLSGLKTDVVLCLAEL